MGVVRVATAWGLSSHPPNKPTQNQTTSLHGGQRKKKWEKKQNKARGKWKLCVSFYFAIGGIYVVSSSKSMFFNFT